MVQEVVDKLNEWAFIADSISSVTCSRERRQRYIEALINLVDSYQYDNRPTWQRALISLLKQSSNHRLNYSQKEVCGMLMVFGAVCRHAAENYDKWWMAWAKEASEEESTKPPKRDPFQDYFDADEELDEDDTQS